MSNETTPDYTNVDTQPLDISLILSQTRFKTI